MKKQNLTLFIFPMFVLLFSTYFNALGQIPEVNNGLITQPKYESTMKNYTHSLKSENHGVRMSAVEIIGRSKMTYFENTLIEMLESEQNEKDKEMIALSLFQLGSLNSIASLKNSLKTSNDIHYQKFLGNLLNKYNEYDELRNEYFEDIVVNLTKAE